MKRLAEEKIEGYESQSPQTGQFNSYLKKEKNKMRKRILVSIPSNGSIQFLHGGNIT